MKLLAFFLLVSVSFGAIQKEMNWYIRAGGAETNGGGYDGTNYPGGTNYADQDSPQLSITDLTSTASTTVTSALSTFTSAMVGNVLRLASGAGTTAGYYVITSYTSASQVTLDRASGTYTAGVAKVGGAHHMLWVYAIGGNGTQPALTSPLAAGHTVNLRGSGNSDPSPASPDYAFAVGSYWTFPNGSNVATAGGYIKLVGYNGRPMVVADLLFYDTGGWEIVNAKFTAVSGGSYNSNGMLNISFLNIHNCVFDQYGRDATIITTNTGNSQVYNNEFRNSGSTITVSTPFALVPGYGNFVFNNWIHGLSGVGLQCEDTHPITISSNLIVGNSSHGIRITNSNPNGYSGVKILNNTIDSNGGDGIKFDLGDSTIGAIVVNNILSNQTGSGKYGLNLASATSAVRSTFIIDYNNFYNNTANRNNVSAGAHDTALDPQFTNTGSNDYSVGTNMKATGYNPAYIGSSTSPTATRTYVDMGAVQRQEAGAGGGGEVSTSFIK